MSLNVGTKPTRTPGGPVALIDGDIICYACAHAADGKYYTVPVYDFYEGHAELIALEKFKYKKDAVKFADDFGVLHRDINIEYEPDPIENCLHSVRVMLESTLAAIGASTYRVFLTGSTNYRNDIAVTYPYKGNRADQRKPEHLDACKEYLTTRWNAETSEGNEADDEMGIAQCSSEPLSTVICSLDKDLDCIPGLHYNWRRNDLYTITPEEADAFFYKQLLAGDDTDNIKGIKGVQIKTAGKILKDCKNDKEKLQVILDEYTGFYADSIPCMDWDSLREFTKKRVEENGKLLWIQREPGVLWEMPEDV